MSMKRVQEPKRAEEVWNRCDSCGRYIAVASFGSGGARREMITPDSDYTAEEFETLCEKCNTAENRDSPDVDYRGDSAALGDALVPDSND